MTTPRYGRKHGFYCRYEGEYNQKQLVESRAERENSRLNKASRIVQDMGVLGVGGRLDWTDRDGWTRSGGGGDDTPEGGRGKRNAR